MAENPKKIDNWKTPAMIRDAPKISHPFRVISNNPLNPVIANKIQPSVAKVSMIAGLVLTVEDGGCV